MPIIEHEQVIATGGTPVEATIRKPMTGRLKILSLSWHSNTVSYSVVEMAHLQKASKTNQQILLDAARISVAVGYTKRWPEGADWPDDYDILLTLDHGTSGAVIFTTIVYEIEHTKTKKGGWW